MTNELRQFIIFSVLNLSLKKSAIIKLEQEDQHCQLPMVWPKLVLIMHLTKS